MGLNDYSRGYKIIGNPIGTPAFAPLRKITEIDYLVDTDHWFVKEDPRKCSCPPGTNHFNQPLVDGKCAKCGGV